MVPREITPEFEEKEAKYAEMIEPYFMGIFMAEDEYYSKVIGDEDNYYFDKSDYSFLVHTDDLEWLMDDFVSTMMGDTAYAREFKRILDLENPRVDVNYSEGVVDAPDVVTGVEKVGGKCYLETPIALEFLSDDIFHTSFHHIATAMHEVAHAMNECNSSEQNILPKFWEGVEVESLFVENLFYLYLFHNADRVAFELQNHHRDERITPENIRRWVQNASVADHVDLFARTAYSMTPEVNPEYDDKAFMARYVVGQVYARCLIEEYKKEPEATMNKFYEFVKNNAGIEHFDEIAQRLFHDKILEERMASITEDKKPCDPHDVVVKNYVEIVFKEMQKIQEYQGE